MTWAASNSAQAGSPTSSPRSSALRLVMTAVSVLVAADVERELGVDAARLAPDHGAADPVARRGVPRLVGPGDQHERRLDQRDRLAPREQPELAQALAGDDRVEGRRALDREGDLGADRVLIDRRDAAAERIAGAGPHHEPPDQIGSRDAGPVELGLEAAHDAGELALDPLEARDDAPARVREPGTAAAAAARLGFDQRPPEEVVHRADRVPGRLVGNAGRTGGRRNTALARDRLEQPHALPPDRHGRIVGRERQARSHGQWVPPSIAIYRPYIAMSTRYRDIPSNTASG